MANPVVTIQGAIKRLAGNNISQGDVPNALAPRLNQLGELITTSPYNGMQQHALEGGLYYYVNEGTRFGGTGGVTTSTTTLTAYDATKAIFYLANNNPVGGPDVIMDTLTVMVDAIAGGAPTFWHWYHTLDTVAANRYTSGQTVPNGTTNTCQNAYGQSPPAVFIASGVLVTAAAGGLAHDVGHTLMANGASVANSIYTIVYGGQERGAGTFTTPTTAVGQSTQTLPAVVIPAGWCYVINEFWVGRTTTAALCEWSATFIVR